MSYTTRAEIEAEVPPPWLVKTLSDSADGIETSGLFDQICTNAAADIDGILAASYTVPFTSNVPAAVTAASRAFVLYKVWFRRVGDEGNPAKAKRDEWEQILKDIASGKRPLGTATSPMGGVIEAPTLLFGQTTQAGW